MLPRYERIAFEKPLVAPPGKPPAAFVCPGHPLLDAVIDLTLERHRDLLRRGAVLVDERDAGTAPRVLFSIEHAIQDGSVTRTGERRVISKRVLYVELGRRRQTARRWHYAPYLDYRPPLHDEERARLSRIVLERPDCAWIDGDLEQPSHVPCHNDTGRRRIVKEHLREVRDVSSGTDRRRSNAEVTDAAHQREVVVLGSPRGGPEGATERAGKAGGRLNARSRHAGARKRVGRLAVADVGLRSLKRERADFRRCRPWCAAALLVGPRWFARCEIASRSAPISVSRPVTRSFCRKWHAPKSSAIAMEAVFAAERQLGFEPT